MIDPKEVEREKAREKARWLRYRKPIVKDINLFSIQNDVDEMLEACSDIHWYTDGQNGDDTLIAALDGNEDEAWEFRMAFAELETQLEDVRNDLDRWWDDLTEYFDVFFVGIKAGECSGGYLGYDEIEEDYYGIDAGMQTELAEETGGKKLMQRTKKDILNIAGTCFAVAMNYFSLRQRYDNLSAAIDILRGQNMALLQQVKEVEDAYEKAAAVEFYFNDPAVTAFEKMINNLPERVWFE